VDGIYNRIYFSQICVELTLPGKYGSGKVYVSGKSFLDKDVTRIWDL
jgi:hypothetical protein